MGCTLILQSKARLTQQLMFSLSWHYLISGNLLWLSHPHVLIKAIVRIDLQKKKWMQCCTHCPMSDTSGRTLQFVWIEDIMGPYSWLRNIMLGKVKRLSLVKLQSAPSLARGGCATCHPPRDNDSRAVTMNICTCINSFSGHSKFALEVQPSQSCMILKHFQAPHKWWCLKRIQQRLKRSFVAATRLACKSLQNAYASVKYEEPCIDLEMHCKLKSCMHTFWRSSRLFKKKPSQKEACRCCKAGTGLMFLCSEI